MSIASELNNLEGNIEDSYDAVNDMGGVIPAQRNMDNLDQAIRTIPQNSGITATTFHWGGSPNYSMYKDSGYTTAATYSDIATAYANGLVYIADGEDEVTYIVVSDIPDAHTITVTGIGLPDYEGASASYAYASSTWTKTATEFQKKLTAGTNVQINGTTISATDTTYSDMVGATSLDAGTHGLVPAPAAGDEAKVLSGAGTWVAQTAAQVNSDWNSNSGVSQILNKPTIPAAQVNSDWDAVSGVAEILNKPTIPTVNDATLTIQHNGTNVQTFTANASSNVTANIETIYADTITPTTAVATIGTAQIADAAVTSDKVDWSTIAATGYAPADCFNVTTGYTLGGRLYKIGKIVFGNITVHKNSGNFSSSQVNVGTPNAGFVPATAVNSFCSLSTSEWNSTSVGYFYVGSGGMFINDSTSSNSWAKATVIYTV